TVAARDETEGEEAGAANGGHALGKFHGSFSISVGERPLSQQAAWPLAPAGAPTFIDSSSSR
ncbi:hypothetical protein PU560_04840, partial [Georgenia sp. 10Sc9-8]|nr:hypothetical protein [Georgenia halotolerans]